MLRVALAQMTSERCPQANLVKIADWAAKAAELGACLVVFPEAAMVRFGEPLAAFAEPIDGRWADAVRAVAERENITIAAGMFTPAADGRVKNTLLVTGAVEASYDKIHLYDAFGYAESEAVMAGTSPVVFDLENTRIGLATCFDIRFPELFVSLAKRGAVATVVAASWGRGPGKAAQWELLARARALDSTSYILACDQPMGDEAGPLGVGRSMVVSPDGTVTKRLPSNVEGLLVADLSRSSVESVRDRIPVLTSSRALDFEG